jgi:nitrite reductase (NADH) small subunit
MSDWNLVGTLEDIPPLGSRIVRTPQGDIAVFRASDDHIFALMDRCPHKGGPLSQGIVHGHSVTCPLHGWVIDGVSGEAQAPDVGCAPRFPVRMDDEGRIFLDLAALVVKAA